MAQHILIKTVKHTLTDGSDVFNVILMDTKNKQLIDFPALTARNAEVFVDEFRKLIKEHTLITDVWTD